MTSTEEIANAVYDRHMRDIADASDQIPYPLANVLDEGPNTSEKPFEYRDDAITGIRNAVIGELILAALIVGAVWLCRVITPIQAFERGIAVAVLAIVLVLRFK